MRLWPTTLTGRLSLAVAIVLLLSNMIAVGVYVYDRFRSQADTRVAWFADRVSAIAERMENTPPQERVNLARSLSVGPQRIQWSQAPPPDISSPREFPADWIESQIKLLLSLDDPTRLRVLLRPLPTNARRHYWDRRRIDHDQPIPVIAYRLSAGDWISMSYLRSPFRPPWVAPFLKPLLVLTLIALALCIWAVRRAGAPVAMLARAADRFGLDLNAAPLSETGPREVREAAQAFNRMLNRLRAFIKDRTRMLAAVSHDLRTPITRMRLRAELLDDSELRSKMFADLDEMETMIKAALSFARDDAAGEAHTALDLAELLRDLCAENAELGRQIRYDGLRQAPFVGAPLGLKRLFSNLIDNAFKFATEATLTLKEDDGHWLAALADNGPGIPEDAQEQVFEPFFRLEESRSRETGGIGLGLSVARSIAQGHGGRLTLRNAPTGGLIAELRLPRGHFEKNA